MTWIFSRTGMKTNRKTIGAIHEDMAAAYLKKAGFTILERNYRNRCGEIDIVAQEGRYLVFCEVKFRKSSASGSPFSAVDLRKQHQICYTAMYYLKDHRIREDTPVRFDVVALTPERITLLRNAFDFSTR